MKWRGEEMFYRCIKPKFILKNAFPPEAALTKPARVPGDFTETEHYKYELFETDRLKLPDQTP